nr:hypothetical protein [Tanacetum cinerariifolium]
GAEAEFAADLELGRDRIERAVIDHPPLGVTRLGPRIGMEQIDPLERGVGKPLDHLQRIAHVQADVGEVAVADMAERADH